MSKLREIFDGYKNLLFENEQVERLAEARLKECEKCKNLDNFELTIMGKKNKMYLHCKLCICYVPAMLRSPTKKCKAGKWNNLLN